jgi:hypothetical protein
MTLRRWSSSDEWDAQALPRNSRQFQAYARRAVRIQRGVDQLGEWTGGLVKGERTAQNDPVVALAWFVAQTITDKCRCEGCEQKRDVVEGLVYGRGVDDLALHRAVAEPPAGAEPVPVPKRGRPRKRRNRAA